MALMKFREPNQVKWLGVRPGHDGTQVLKGDTAVNDVTIIHTVTAGKTLHLVEWSVFPTSVAAGFYALFIRDGADATIRYLGGGYAVGNAAAPGANGFSYPPIEVLAGYDVCVQSGVAALTARGDIFGWEE